ncbi:MAG: hypothetical protein A2133_05855 [Actinobacteria bacterium RBG_16_64_13]|nr:MAG: hypothetical protein A2133_05855 [Actinobacteria bacterium RBG_16_64_13]
MDDGNGRQCLVRLEPSEQTVYIAFGGLLEEAITQAGLSVPLPCGGQGRCGRCVVQVREGTVRRRSALRLSEDDIEQGYALACQTLIEGDLTVWVPPHEELVQRLEAGDRAEKAAPEVMLCDHAAKPWVARYQTTVEPPSMGDNTPDLERLQRELARQHGLRDVRPTLAALAKLPTVLREGEWTVTVEIEQGDWAAPDGPYRLLDVLPGSAETRVLGLAIDIGTTSVATYLGDLETGELVDHASAFNSQIARGEDVISRIIYARQPEHRQELQERVITTINALVDEMLARQNLMPERIALATVAGNTTMIHLFLGLEPQYIRTEPYIPAAGKFPPVPAVSLGLHMRPEALVDCLPVVGAYVGGDITAGLLRTGMHEQEAVTLFIDVGTNGEMVLGNSDWLITCACSAGPAFEGAGATSGTPAVTGAIEQVWIDPRSLEPTWATLGDAPPIGICGSGMISLLGEMMITGVIDKGGRIAGHGRSPRVRRGEEGPEYVIVWAAETGAGDKDIVLTETDIQNLLRAKAAIYAGATVLCESVGLAITDVERVLIGGGFGRHIDVEKAIQIGLLPDMPWEQFTYLGNTSIQGAYLALTCREGRAQADELANKMTYLELSADGRFMDAFTSALFIPHTDESRFPSVQRALAEARPERVSHHD